MAADFVKLAVGEAYHMHIQIGEGAAAQFLMRQGNVLQIQICNITTKELAALKSGMIKAGFLYDAGAMLLLFQFYGQDGKPLLTFDCPFDIRLLTASRRNLQDIDNAEQRLAIDIHVIDENKILRALRVVTMPPDMTRAFLAAVMDQLAALDKPGIMEGWLRHEPSVLIEKAESWILGR